MVYQNRSLDWNAKWIWTKGHEMGAVKSDLWTSDGEDGPGSIWGRFGYGDKVVLKKGHTKWESFEWRGYRYIQLTFRNCLQPVKLESFKI